MMTANCLLYADLVLQLSVRPFCIPQQPDLRADLGDRGGAQREACIVNQDVDLCKLLRQPPRQRLNCCGVPHVQRLREHWHLQSVTSGQSFVLHPCRSTASGELQRMLCKARHGV